MGYLKDRIVPIAARRENQSFEQIMKRWQYDETDEILKIGFVPSTLNFMVDKTDRILGAIHLRHIIYERLRLNGGKLEDKIVFEGELTRRYWIYMEDK